MDNWIESDLGIVRELPDTIFKSKIGKTAFKKIREGLSTKESSYRLNINKDSEAIVFLSNNIILVV